MRNAHAVFKSLLFSPFPIRARLDCLTKPCDIIHMIVFSPRYQSDSIVRCLHCLSNVLIIRETKIVHTKLGNSIKKLNNILTISPMDQMDMYTVQSTHNGCVTDFLLLSAA